MATYKATLIADRLGFLKSEGEIFRHQYDTLDVATIHDLEKKRKILADHVTWFSMPIGARSIGSPFELC